MSGEASRADGRRPRAIAPRRSDFGYFQRLETRWMDLDVYGHVNNVVYYSYFDSAVGGHLIRAGGLDPAHSSVIGLVVETSCTFKKPLTFPEPIEVGLRVQRLGTSSVEYEIGVFKEGDDTAAAFGRFVHVYVDRATRRPVPIPADRRAAIERLGP